MNAEQTRRLLSLYRPYRGWMGLGVFLALLTVMANIGLLALSGWFIASMGLAGVAGTSMNYFGPAAIIRGLAITRTAGRYGERIVTHEATFRLIAQLRVWFYGILEPLAPAILQQQRSGDWLSRLQKDIDRLDAVYLRIALPLIVAAVGSLIVTLFIAIYSPLLAITNLLFLVLGGLVLPLWIHKRVNRFGREQVQMAAAVRTHVIDGVQGMAELVAYGADGRHAAQLGDLSDAWLTTQDMLNRPRSFAVAGQLLLSQFALWAAIILLVPLVQLAEVAPANLVMLTLLCLASFELIAPLPNAMSLFAETGLAMARVLGLADAKAAVAEPVEPMPLPAHGDLRLENVDLRYPGQTQHALSNINLNLPAGSRTLLLGPSGAGKSSLVNVLLRFWAPERGHVFYAQQDIADFDSDQWRQRLAVVSQHTQLINGTIRDNLLLARPQATTRELMVACEKARITEFAHRLPEGLDTWLGETGTKLSGGQARRVAIARALLKQAPILILDEPTEGLDRTTEKHVMDGLRELMEGRTVLLITHRALDIGVVDQELRLDSGRLLSAESSAPL